MAISVSTWKTLIAIPLPLLLFTSSEAPRKRKTAAGRRWQGRSTSRPTFLPFFLPWFVAGNGAEKFQRIRGFLRILGDTSSLVISTKEYERRVDSRLAAEKRG